MMLNGSIQQFEEKSAVSPEAGSQTPIKQGSVVELVPENAPSVDLSMGAADDEYWLALSDRLGVPYRLPRRAAPCTVETMKLWLERLDRTNELERLLQDWYHFSRCIHVGEIDRPLIQDPQYYYFMVQLERYFPEELRARLRRIRGMILNELEQDHEFNHIDKMLGRFVVDDGMRPSFLLRQSLRRRRGGTFRGWLSNRLRKLNPAARIARWEVRIVARLADFGWLRRQFRRHKEAIRRLPWLPVRLRVLLRL